MDDQASHRYMHCVDGKKGWAHWGRNGRRAHLENPQWRASLAEYADLTANNAVKLDVDSAVKLAYVHSPLNKRALETLYLTSLDVTGERFRLDTQFFGGTGGDYRHQGGLSPGTIAFNPLLGRYEVAGPFNTPEVNRLTLTNDITARRRLATAGEVLVGFANSFAFEFTGNDVSLASSLVNFSFIQPLLRGAGRDVALEQLTLSERRLLANLRAYSQFRQGFFTQIVIGELGVAGPQRGLANTTLQSFSGVGGVNGYLGLLQQAQQIRNTEDNLRLQLRTRDRLEALYDNELIDIVQVDQFRQNIEVTRANLLDQTNGLKLAVDNYKTGTLGLPADLAVDVDEKLVEGFQLIPSEATPILESLLELQSGIGDIGELSDLSQRVQILDDELLELPQQDTDNAGRTLRKLHALVEAVDRRLKDLPNDVKLMQEKDQGHSANLSDVDQSALRIVSSQTEADSEQFRQQFDDAAKRLERFSDNLTDDNRNSVVTENSQWFDEMLLLCRGVVLVQWASRDISSEPKQVLADAQQFVDPVQKLFTSARADLQRMDEVTPDRERSMRDDEKGRFERDRERLHERLDELESGVWGFNDGVKYLNQLQKEDSKETRRKTIRGLTVWVQAYLQLTERMSLIPAQARLEIITVENVELDADQAFQIALANRLDFMNGRAALVDRWRAIQVAADALQSDLTITGSGDVRTAKNNPVDFRAATSSVRLGLEFDAPLARLLERNGYRETLIDYQRSRRSLIQSHDSLQKGLRALLRTLEQRRLQLEIQRRAVTIALRRVDQTQLSLLTPPAQGQPGVRPQINPTTAINLLGAQSALLNSRNSLLAAWLDYYAARLRLYRELGVMQLDPSGKWIETSIDFGSKIQPVPPFEGIEPLPPGVPIELSDGSSMDDDCEIEQHRKRSMIQPVNFSESQRKDVADPKRRSNPLVRLAKKIAEFGETP